MFTPNEDSLIIWLRDWLQGMFALEFLLPKEQLNVLLESQRMLKILVNCMDTQVETMENSFVDTNNFLAKLGQKQPFWTLPQLRNSMR